TASTGQRLHFAETCCDAGFQPACSWQPDEGKHVLKEYPVKFFGKCNHDHYGPRTFLIMTRDTDPVLYNEMADNDQAYIDSLIQTYLQ
ncbi:MAG: hypothetical protein D6795_08895, partial [Deltaproteobacteria bacterium]